MALERPWRKLPEYIAKLYPNVTNDVTSQVKGCIFDNLSSLASPGKVVILTPALMGL